jgi:hypothetical protein
MFMDLNSKVFFNFCVSLFVSQSRTGGCFTESHGVFTESHRVFFCFTEYHGGCTEAHRVFFVFHGGTLCITLWNTVELFFTEVCVTESHGGYTESHRVFFYFSLCYTVYYSVEHCGTLFHRVARSFHRGSQSIFCFTVVHCVLLCGTL